MRPRKHPDTPGSTEFLLGAALLMLALFVVGMSRVKLFAELERARATLELEGAAHEREVAKLREQLDGTLDHFNDKKAAKGADPVA